MNLQFISFIILILSCVILMLACIDLAIDVYHRKVDTAKLALLIGVVGGYTALINKLFGV